MFRLVVAALAICIAVPAYAQGQNCGPRAAVLEVLHSKYGESRQSVALDPQRRVVEMFANRESGSWTLTITLPNGLTCLMASGQSYEPVSEQLEPAGQRL